MHQHRALLLLLLNRPQHAGNVARLHAPSEQGTVNQRDIGMAGKNLLVFMAAKIAQIHHAADAQLADGGEVVTVKLFAAVQFAVHAIQIGILFDELHGGFRRGGWRSGRRLRRGNDKRGQ